MTDRPSFIRHWRDAEYATVSNPTDVDQTAAYSNLSEDTGLSRLGIGHLRLPPDARSVRMTASPTQGAASSRRPARPRRKNDDPATLHH